MGEYFVHFLDQIT